MTPNNFLTQKRMKIIDTINYHLSGFGFENINDLAISTFHTDKNFLSISATTSILAIVSCFIETYIGLSPIVYICFLGLIGVEFFTGIKSSLKRGRKIESRKFGRIIVKMGLYTLILGFIHNFKGMDSGLNIYNVIYFIFFNYVVIQLIISVLENLGKLGYTESGRAIAPILKALSKWFDFDDPKDKD